METITEQGRWARITEREPELARRAPCARPRSTCHAGGLMGEYRCPDCERPEGEMHKSGCRFDEGTNLVDWSDRDDELRAEWEADQREAHPHG